MAFAGISGALLGACSIAPRPLESTELTTSAIANIERATADQEPMTGAITLYEAMARTLKYNLDYRVEIMQTEVRQAELTHASLDMLPNMVASSAFSQRNNDLATGHLDLPTGIVVPPTATSQDRSKHTEEATFSWNILDFALSYVRARQAADKFLIAEESKRKAIHRIIEDTRTAYWRAVSASRLLRRVEGLEVRVQRALISARSLQKTGEMAPTASMTYERELIKIKQTSQQLARELTLARAQLAALMDVPPGMEFKLADGYGDLRPPLLGLSTQEMVKEALFNRPELRDLSYQRRINEAEAYAAFLELLPGAQLYASQSVDSNHFLLNQQWISMGITAAENLIRVFQLPGKQKAIVAKDGVLDTQLLATTMVVMTQVHVSKTRYQHFATELAIGQEYHDVQSKLLAQIRAQAATDIIGEQTLIREEMNALVAELKRDIAFVNLQNAAANVFVSMGLELQAQEVDHMLHVRQLAGRLEALWALRGGVSQRGQFLIEMEAQKAEARRRAEEEARNARIEAALRVRQAEIARAQDVARHNGWTSLKDSSPGNLKERPTRKGWAARPKSKKDLQSIRPRTQAEPTGYTGVK